MGGDQSTGQGGGDVTLTGAGRQLQENWEGFVCTLVQLNKYMNEQEYMSV